MSTEFRYDAAKVMLSSPPMWRWAESCFDEYSDGSGKWVDTERLEKIRDTEALSTTQHLMISVALNILEGEAGSLVNLSNLIGHFDADNWKRFIDAITIVRDALKPPVVEIDGLVFTFDAPQHRACYHGTCELCR